MKIYVSHAGSYDYRSELYEPLRRSALAEGDELFLPHEAEGAGLNAQDVLRECGLVLAEVSYPSTGQGIELAWAVQMGVPVLCLYKEGRTPSFALSFLGLEPVAYGSFDDLVARTQEVLAHS